MLAAPVGRLSPDARSTGCGLQWFGETLHEQLTVQPDLLPEVDILNTT